MPLVLTIIIVTYVDQLRIGTKFSEPPPDQTNLHPFFPALLHSHKICCWPLTSNCCQVYDRELLYSTTVYSFTAGAGKALPLPLPLHRAHIYLHFSCSVTVLMKLTITTLNTYRVSKSRLLETFVPPDLFWSSGLHTSGHFFTDTSRISVVLNLLLAIFIF